MSICLLEFGDLRTKPVKGEHYRITWSKDGIVKYDDKTKVTLKTEDAKGIWKVNVQLVTSEVRKDLKGVLQDSATFEVK